MAVDASVEYLSIMAAVFSALSALFGVYLVLFVLAIWSTFRHKEKTQTRLRIVTIVLFLILCMHYINRALSLWRARVFPAPADEFMVWTIPMTFIGAISTTLSGVVSDSLLAWRFYVIYDRKPWALYGPATALLLNTLLGLSGDFQHLTVYQHTVKYETDLKNVTFEITAYWGWVMFAINSFLTGSILWRIVSISRTSNKVNAAPLRQTGYGVAVEAIVESALVTWVGILLYEISSFAPTGNVTSNLDVGFVMVCVLPIFFGISQCLITARLGFATRPQSSTVVIDVKNPDLLTSSSSTSGSGTLAQEISVKIERRIEVTSLDDQNSVAEKA